MTIHRSHHAAILRRQILKLLLYHKCFNPSDSLEWNIGSSIESACKISSTEACSCCEVEDVEELFGKVYYSACCEENSAVYCGFLRCMGLCPYTFKNHNTIITRCIQFGRMISVMRICCNQLHCGFLRCMGLYPYSFENHNTAIAYPVWKNGLGDENLLQPAVLRFSKVHGIVPIQFRESYCISSLEECMVLVMRICCNSCIIISTKCV